MRSWPTWPPPSPRPTCSKACERIADHLDPDGPDPDPHAAFERRGLNVARVGAMMTIRGQVDPEAGAALLTALDAVMTPPRGDDLRTPNQRRADALADIVAQVAGRGRLPTVHGVRPHLGILITPDTLLGPDPTPPPHPVSPARRVVRHRAMTRPCGPGCGTCSTATTLGRPDSRMIGDCGGSAPAGRRRTAAAEDRLGPSQHGRR